MNPDIAGTGGQDRRPQFDLDAFVRDGKQTMFCLSKEGKGSTGLLATVMTVAVTGAAERPSEQSPYGRLPVPLILALDEAATFAAGRTCPTRNSISGPAGSCR